MGFASVVNRLGPHSIFAIRHRSERVREPMVWIQIKRLLQLVNGYLFAFKFSEPVLHHVQYLRSLAASTLSSITKCWRSGVTSFRLLLLPTY